MTMIEAMPRRNSAELIENRPVAVDSDRLVPLLLVLGSVVVRLPFQPDFLVNFDAVNYAFALEDFDLEHHQPHPPGYLGYVLVGRLIDAVLGDATRSLTVLSVLTCGVAVYFLYRLSRRYADVASSALVVTLFSVSGLAWYYGLVGLTYMPATAITLGFVLACHRARFGADPRGLYLAAVALACLGALRQTDLVMFLPLAVFSSLRLPVRVRVRSAALFGVLTILWLLPLLWLSGGVRTYVELSRDLASLAGGPTSVFTGDVSGLLTNVRLVASGAFAGLLTILPLLFIARRGVFSRETTVFLALWTLPPLAVFVLIHTGQVGYVLPIVPAVHVVIAGMLAAWRRDHAGEGRSGQARAIAAGALLVVVSLAVSAAGPRWMVETAFGDRSSGARQVSMPIVGDWELPAPHQVRPISLAVHDDHWRAVLDRMDRTDPARTAVLARLDGSVRFRPLTYYLRDHVIYTLGAAGPDRFGNFFTAHDGTTDYSVDALSHPDPSIDLPASVTELMIFDLDPDRLVTDLPARWETVGDGTDLVTLTVPVGATIHVDIGDDGEWLIDLERPT